MPWSNAVTNLVTDCIALTTGNTTELQKLYNLLQMKTMLNDRYDVKDFNYNENTGQVSPNNTCYIYHMIIVCYV